jgi:hemerythrin
MKWNNSFAIGIETIDVQHKKIFERLLAIENAVAKRDPWHIQRFLLSQLADYMKFHLAVEEALLEIVGYPGRLGHNEAHIRHPGADRGT